MVRPERTHIEVEDDPGNRNKTPDSTNPASSELTFALADEARDVSARLAEFQAQERQGASKLALGDAWRQAHRTGREFLNAEEEYILASIALLVEQHRWSPRLFNTVDGSFTGSQTDGDVANTLRLVNELSVRQRLPFGGEAAARWIFDATENLRSAATEQYEQSSRLVFDARVPLLRDAGLIAQEDLIQASRDLVYASRAFEDFRRGYLVALARDFFALLQQLDGIDSQINQLESVRALELRQRAWYEAGRLAEFEVNQARNDVLAAVASLETLRERYTLSLDRFKVRLGLPVRTALEIVRDELPLPEPETTPDAATQAALAYRLDLQNRRDRLDDSRRAIVNAKNQLLPDLDLRGSVTLGTDPDAREGGVVYELDDVQYSAGFLLDVPLDREIERLALRRTQIAAEQDRRGFEQFRDELILTVRASVREIDRARSSLRLAEERVETTQRRKEEIDLKADEVDTRDQLDVANDLLRAEQDRNQAKTDLRNAILDYLLATGQLRVKRDGTFQPLPGMEGG